MLIDMDPNSRPQRVPACLLARSLHDFFNREVALFWVLSMQERRCNPDFVRDS
jgi:hypothetical protein